MDVHLAGGRTEREGSIEVQLAPGGRWSSLSGEDAGAAARLACVELGFGGGVARVGPLFTESGGAAPAAIASLRCGANATTLNECSFAGVLEASYWPGPGPLGAACDGALACRPQAAHLCEAAPRLPQQHARLLQTRRPAFPLQAPRR